MLQIKRKFCTVIKLRRTICMVGYSLYRCVYFVLVVRNSLFSLRKKMRERFFFTRKKERQILIQIYYYIDPYKIHTCMHQIGLDCSVHTNYAGRNQNIHVNVCTVPKYDVREGIQISFANWYFFVKKFELIS